MDDLYGTFNKDNYTITAFNKRYKMGDKVHVILKDASKEERYIRFDLKEKTLTK